MWNDFVLGFFLHACVLCEVILVSDSSVYDKFYIKTECISSLVSHLDDNHLRNFSKSNLSFSCFYSYLWKKKCNNFHWVRPMSIMFYSLKSSSCLLTNSCLGIAVCCCNLLASNALEYYSWFTKMMPYIIVANLLFSYFIFMWMKIFSKAPTNASKQTNQLIMFKA